MKRMLVMAATTAVVMTAGLFLSGSADAGRIVNREARQQARIGEGVATGELTHGEAHALRAEQRGIRAAKRVAWSDGHLSAAERARIEGMQDRANGDIYQLKHNARTR